MSSDRAVLPDSVLCDHAQAPEKSAMRLALMGLARSQGTFAAALILMGSATTLIRFLPSYHTAGVLSPLALVLLRLLQGLAVGGQRGGATLLATEGAPQSKRGLYGSIAQAGVPVGVALLANLPFLAARGGMASEAFMPYGWAHSIPVHHRARCPRPVLAFSRRGDDGVS